MFVCVKMNLKYIYIYISSHQQENSYHVDNIFLFLTMCTRTMTVRQVQKSFRTNFYEDVTVQLMINLLFLITE